MIYLHTKLPKRLSRSLHFLFTKANWITPQRFLQGPWITSESAVSRATVPESLQCGCGTSSRASQSLGIWPCALTKHLNLRLSFHENLSFSSKYFLHVVQKSSHALPSFVHRKLPFPSPRYFVPIWPRDVSALRRVSYPDLMNIFFI